MRKFSPLRALVACLTFAAVGSASAAIISVGTYIPPPPYGPLSTFVVPIEITGAPALTSWQFSLSFDPNDVQINTSCDASGSDPYCDPLFGPVTPGTFFAGAVFPSFFDPGFIFNDVGLLDAASGAWQDPPPGPSGHGILAYVEFITTANGTGKSPITVTDASVTASVPEPATLALLAAALLLLGVRREAVRRAARAADRAMATRYPKLQR